MGQYWLGIFHQPTVRAFQKAGFWVARKGEHITMTNGERIITIPKADSVDAFTMVSILKNAGLTNKELKDLLRIVDDSNRISRLTAKVPPCTAFSLTPTK